MSSQKAMVQRYTEGFRSGDLAQIVSCLTEDVVWAAGRAKRREKSAGRAKRREKSLHGMKTLTGRDAFAAEVDATGVPTHKLYLDRLIEEGDTVAVVCRLDTFHVWLGEVPAA